MKRKIVGIIAAVVFSAGGAIYAVNSNPSECPLQGTSDCPLVQDCHLEGTPDCPLVKSGSNVPDCCKKK